jgi:hypothetical protein
MKQKSGVEEVYGMRRIGASVSAARRLVFVVALR